MAKNRYTPAQRHAYNSGYAYRLGREHKEIVFKKYPENKKSFSAGYTRAGKSLAKYKDTSK